mgnify:CR=1 FL=1
MKSIDSEIFVGRLAEHYAEEICHLHWDRSRPWTLLFAVILSAQCTDKRVNQVTPELFKQFSDLESYVAKPIEELERVIYSTGFYKNKAKSLRGAAEKLLLNFESQLPDNMDDLTSLSGVGRKTANVILWNVFRKNVGFVVDTHIGRISQRVGLTRQKTPEKIEQDLMKKLPQDQWGNISHQLIQFGRDRCKAPKPKCEGCFFEDVCPKRGVRGGRK